jgi:hypothetical protein
LIFPDTLRPPTALDPTAAAYKDWLHLNLLDHSSGTVGLVNVSLHGAPTDPRSRAVGTALLHVPAQGWIGNVEVWGIDEADLGPASVGLPGVALALASDGAVLASVGLPDDELRLDLTAAPAAPPLDIELPIPLGPGWISWRVVPRLSVEGTVVAAGVALDTGAMSAYHDHNWGRWHWGDDLGWEWGCLIAAAPGPSFVVSRTTDRTHRVGSQPMLMVEADGRRRSFLGATVELAVEGILDAEPRRLPGSMAALHADRATPRVPARLTVRADDGRSLVRLDFRARAFTQLVTADPSRRGYGFLHELVGEFEYLYRMGGRRGEGVGLAVVEYVD